MQIQRYMLSKLLPSQPALAFNMHPDAEQERTNQGGVDFGPTGESRSTNRARAGMSQALTREVRSVPGISLQLGQVSV